MSDENELNQKQDKLATKFLAVIEDKISTALSKLKLIKRVYGTVVSYVDGTGYAIININGMNFRLINKSGEKLTVGDTVQVHYWKSLADGYVAIRQGKPDPLGGGGGGFAINNAVIITEEQTGVYNTNNEVVNVDVANRCSVVYGEPRNAIIVQGNLAYIDSSNEWAGVLANTEGFYKYSSGNKIHLNLGETYGDNTYECKLYSITKSTTYGVQLEYRVWINGEPLTAYSTQYDTCSKATSAQTNTSHSDYNDEFYIFNNIPTPSFIIKVNSINTPTEKYQYGSVSCNVVLGLFDEKGNLFANRFADSSGKRLLFYKTLAINTSGNTISFEALRMYYLAINEENYKNPIRTIPFASQAEYDYAISVTKRTELPPSVLE